MHLTRPLYPRTHSREYLMHKYWSRKPHNIVASYIEQYSKEGETVLDPFGGSGVTLNEALHLGRKCIMNDINELSSFIARNTVTLVETAEFERVALGIASGMREKIKELYKTKCTACGNTAEITHVLWKDFISCKCGGNLPYSRKEHGRKETIKCPQCNRNIPLEGSIEARPYMMYYRCSCNERPRGLVKEPNEEDILENERLKKTRDYKGVLDELPSLRQALVYPNAKPFNQLRHFLRKDPRLCNLFTPRNLISLHLLLKEITSLPENDRSAKDLKDMMLFLFSSMLPQASKMVWVIKRRKSRELSRPEVGSWTHHILWNPTEFFEVNVLNGFLERLKKIKRGLKEKWKWENGDERWVKVAPKAGEPWWLVKKSKMYPHVSPLKECTAVSPKIARSANDFLEEKDRNALIMTGSATRLDSIPPGVIDYIFTDPPYGDSIQYLELSMFYLAWLPPFDISSRIENMAREEITINPKQDKQHAEYGMWLKAAFKECHRVLKDGGFITITFHNTDVKVRGIIFDAMLDSGFVFQQINYQPPPRPSEKSLLHEFGTPVGDYIITFKKTQPGTATLSKDYDVNDIFGQAIDDIFIARKEPVPFNYLLNLVDIQLLEMGHVPPATSHSLKNFLQESKRYTWFKKKGWYFSDTFSPDGSKGVPLTERIDGEIKKVRAAHENVDDLDREIIINSVFRTFNGILTPDLGSLKKRVNRFFK